MSPQHHQRLGIKLYSFVDLAFFSPLSCNFAAADYKDNPNKYFCMCLSACIDDDSFMRTANSRCTFSMLFPFLS